MTLNMEVKKDALRQTQDGIWKLTITVLPEDMPVELLQAPMGTPYGLAMVPIDYDNPVATSKLSKEELLTTNPPPTSHETRHTVGGRSEGDKLRGRAFCLCGEEEFQRYAFTRWDVRDGPVVEWGFEERAIQVIYRKCNIKSRSELTYNPEAQALFRELDNKYKDWQTENKYKDNLDRE